MFPQNDQGQDPFRMRAEMSQQIRRHYQTAPVAAGIPLLQSVISGFVVGACVGSLAWLLHWETNPFVVFVVAMVFALAFTWFRSVLRWESLINRLEGVFDVDLNRDGRIGGDPGKVIRVEVLENSGRSMTIADLPIEESKLIDFASGLEAGQSFSESAWSGAGALFSRSQFRALRDEFLKRGWLSWRNPEAPGQGLELTHSGRAVVRSFAAMAGSPSPTLKDRGA